MKYWGSNVVLLIVAAALAPALSQATDLPEGHSLSTRPITIQLVDDEPEIAVYATDTLSIRYGERMVELPAGTYRLVGRNVVRPSYTFHLFSKTFQVGQDVDEAVYAARMEEEGFDPVVTSMGTRFVTDQGTVLDNRVRWVSIARYPSMAEAEAAKKDLEAAEQWTWLRRELSTPGEGEVMVHGTGDLTYGPFQLPLRLDSTGDLGVNGVDRGLWEEIHTDVFVAGSLEVSVGSTANLSLVERVPIETYLRGVLPAEMPPAWPAEALKAQAVSARSDVLASLGLRHALEGFEFCGREHCRAYLGSASPHESTSAAIDDTHGVILVSDGRITPTVFSSNCGGWTENNDTVWFGPPDLALRGVSDVREGTGELPAERGVARWLLDPPEAFCSEDDTYFRWRRTYSGAELRAMMNARQNLGGIRDIQLGDRGVSGRLKWLRVIGTEETVTIKKELPIRSAFGGLPSAMFVVDIERDSELVSKLTIYGGGRGHGVGMCQHGARGRSLAGMGYAAILGHYFPDSRVERYR